MLRQSHSLPGLMGALLLAVLAVTGAILSINPVQERLHTTIPAAGDMSVADLAGRLAANYQGVEQIQRTPSGSIIVYFTEGNHSGVDLVDPETGKAVAAYETSSIMRWVKNLHRSLLLDTAGRVASGTGAALMLLLTVSGAFLLAARSGGWRRILRPVGGTPVQRLHAAVARFAILGLLLAATTGLYLSAGSLGLIAEPVEAEVEFPSEAGAGTPQPVETLAALRATDLSDLRELVYPYAGDPTDGYSLLTHQGAGFVDASSGALLSFQAHSTRRQVYEFIYMLHTGEGLWWLGLWLGLSALAVPVLAVSGIQIWWKRHRALPRLTGNSPADAADTVILVGSENNTTWGFAKTLHDALTGAGQRVHTTSMNRLAAHYRKAERLLILTATHGDGDAPTSANQFLAKLEKFEETPLFQFSVLGFGDRQFPKFCQFAVDVDAALTAKGWTALGQLGMIDRQSSQEFARWCKIVGERIGVELDLEHSPECPKTSRLQLVERVDYGIDADTPTTVLRFKPTRQTDKPGTLRMRYWPHRLPRFEAGDLVGILPPGSHTPRFYSLASSSQEGILEICVRRQPGGLCSGYLHSLQPGATINAFIRHNPSFRPNTGKASVILIGAGTGIGPLAGFIKHNTPRQPMYLYWGGRNPQSDFLYQPELNRYLQDRRLTELNTTFSRSGDRAYVQDKIDADAAKLRELILKGAQILICGGREMANGVMATIDEIVAPLHTSVQTLKAEGRYREDVY